MAHHVLGYLLPPELQRDLEAYCEVTGDDPVDVIADALELHFDALAGEIVAPLRAGDQLDLPPGMRAS